MNKTMHDYPRALFRCTWSLPAELAQDVSYIAKRLGVSQSALITELMSEPVARLSALFRETPDNPTPEQVMRLRGKSVDLVRSVVAGAMAAADDFEQTS